MYQIKAYIKRTIVNIVAVVLVCIGLAGRAYRKAKQYIVRALAFAKQYTSKAFYSSKRWTTTKCFPWLRNAWWTIDYAVSRAWQWIKQQVPSWREIRAPIIVALVVLIAIYGPGIVNPPPKPTVTAGSQSLHIGPQVDLSDLESGSDGTNAALGYTGDAYFVSLTGDNSNSCESWDEACLGIQYVIDNKVTDGNGDVVYLGAGEFDTGEILIDKSLMSLVGSFSTIIENSVDTSNGSAVLRVTGGTVTIRNVNIFKDDLVSLNSYGIYLDDVGTILLDNIRIVVPPVFGGPHTGIFVDSGDGIIINDVTISGIAVPIGTGIVFSDTVRSGVAGGLSGIGRLGIGVQFTAGTDETFITSDVVIVSCTVGVQLDSGVTSNSINVSITDSVVEILDNSGNATNTARGSITSLRTATEHSGEMFPGTFYVVDGENGIDTNNGRSPDEAVATIGHALELVSPGDGVVIRADGVYTENIVVDTNAVQIFAAPGVVISGTGSITPTILVTGDNVWFRRQMDVLGSGAAVCVEANNVRIDDMTVNAATTAFDMDGNNIVLNNTRATGYTISGYDISGTEPDISTAHAGGSGAATVGYVISSTVDGGLFRQLSSVQNVAAGISVALGATNNIFVDCTSGTGDGDRVDANLTNMWSNYVDTQSRWRHEHNWPAHAGQGVASDPTTVDNEATDDTPVVRDDQDYWGDTIALIQIGNLDTSWRSLGLEIIAGTANKNAEWQIFYPTPSASAARNGGNAWDLAETVLTTDGTFTFLVDDVVWITSDSDPSGEIMLVTNVAGAVITVASETRASGNTGLRYNHAGNEVMYLAERPGNEAWHATEGIYAAASSKDFDTIYFAFARENQANSAMVIRLVNGSDDGIFTLTMKPKYEATKEHD